MMRRKSILPHSSPTWISLILLLATEPYFLHGAIFDQEFVSSKHFIDKTSLLKNFFATNASRKFITAPSGFGKTTNLKMIEKFSQVAYDSKGELLPDDPATRDLFKSLEIGQDETIMTKHLAQHPVIFFDMALKIDGEITKDKILRAYSAQLNETYYRYKWVIDDHGTDLSIQYLKAEQHIIGKAMTGVLEEYELKEGILRLAILLNVYFNRTVILLIDNYDAIVHDSFIDSKGCLDPVYSILEEILFTAFQHDNQKVIEFTMMASTTTIGFECFGFHRSFEQFCFYDNHKLATYFGLSETEVVALTRKYYGDAEVEVDTSNQKCQDDSESEGDTKNHDSENEFGSENSDDSESKVKTKKKEDSESEDHSLTRKYPKNSAILKIQKYCGGYEIKNTKLTFFNTSCVVGYLEANGSSTWVSQQTPNETSKFLWKLMQTPEHLDQVSRLLKISPIRHGRHDFLSFTNFTKIVLDDFKEEKFFSGANSSVYCYMIQIGILTPVPGRFNYIIPNLRIRNQFMTDLLYYYEKVAKIDLKTIGTRLGEFFTPDKAYDEPRTHLMDCLTPVFTGLQPIYGINRRNSSHQLLISSDFIYQSIIHMGALTNLDFKVIEDFPQPLSYEKTAINVIRRCVTCIEKSGVALIIKTSDQYDLPTLMTAGHKYDIEKRDDLDMVVYLAIRFERDKRDKRVLIDIMTSKFEDEETGNTTFHYITSYTRKTKPTKPKKIKSSRVFTRTTSDWD